jgi:putative ABC transport system permease protein
MGINTKPPAASFWPLSSILFLYSMRLALRSLLKSPGFTLIALATLALGIGVNTAMFSVVNALLLQPAPYPEPQQLVRVFRTAAQSQILPHSLLNLQDMGEQSRSLSALAAYSFWSYSLAAPGQPAESLSGITASADVFAVMGVQPSLGRGFTAEEQRPGNDRVAVLSAAFWRQRFNGDPQVIGRTLRIDGENVVVIGVLPDRADYPLFWGQVDIWRPLRLSNDWRQLRNVPWLNAIGRLRPGVSLEQAQTELDTISAQLAREYPDINTGSGLQVVPLQGSAMADTTKRVTWLTLGLAGFVLLIACANLANLQLARAAANARAFAVRVALGASRATLIRQSLAESLLLAFAGGVLGLVIASWANDLLGRQIAIGPGGLEISLDLSVFSFALLASLAAGAIFGTLPAWIASRVDVNEVLKSQARGSTGNRSQHRLRHGLVVAEITLTLVLLSGAGLFLRGLQRFTERDLGWQSNGLLTGTMTLPDHRYSGDDERRQFHERLLERLKALPGVEQAALASHLPLTAATNAPLTVFVQGRAAPPAGREPLTYVTMVSTDFFTTLRIPLVEGRLFDATLRPGNPPVIVINETMARTLFPRESALGKRIATTLENPIWHEVIGVVRDVRYAADLGAPPTQMQAYRPFVLEPWGYLTAVVRAPAPATLAEPLRRAVAELDGDLPVADLRTTSQAVNQSQTYFRIANSVLGGFALLGLLLSAIGLYGVIAGLVVRRTSEFGIRLALGAQRRDVLRLVVNAGLRLALLGVALGVGCSFVLAFVLGRVAPELPAQDPLAIAAVSLLLVVVALVACYLPARRATRVDPITALRAE